MSYAKLKLEQTHLEGLGSIFRTPRPIQGLFANEEGQSYAVIADKPAFPALARLFMFAATRKPALLRISGVGQPDFKFGSGVPHDLVLCHQASQFKPSRWAEIRASKIPWRLSTFKVVEAPAEVPNFLEVARNDPADFSHHANTVFIHGSSATFRLLATMAYNMAGAYGPGDHDHLFDVIRGGGFRKKAPDFMMCYWPFVRPDRHFN